MVIPDDQFLLVPAGLLLPKRDDSLLIRNKNGKALVKFVLKVLFKVLTNFENIFFTVTGRVRALELRF